jgi:hypothetical protein
MFEIHMLGGILMFKKESESELETLPFKFPLDPETYLRNRLKKELDWHKKRADSKQSWFRFMQILQITFSSAIPVLSGLASSAKWMPLTVGILGAAVTAITGFSKTFRFQDLLGQYRSTFEALKREEALFLAQCKPYDTEDSFKTFVERIEGLLDKENSIWLRSLTPNQQRDQNSNPATNKTPPSGPNISI